MENKGISIPSTVEANLDRLENESQTIVYVGRNGRVEALLGLSDLVKEESKRAIKTPNKMGLDTALLTGDHQRTAEAVAGELNIKSVLAEVLPDEKSAEIRRLQERGLKVAMVGDGINDAPALTQADVGIAPGSGTDIAIESSDITLVGDSPMAVTKAIHLSKAIFRKIRQNLFWTYCYNSIAIPLAVLGLLHPLIAELAMGASSLTVVGNANTLHRLRLEG